MASSKSKDNQSSADSEQSVTKELSYSAFEDYISKLFDKAFSESLSASSGGYEFQGFSISVMYDVILGKAMDADWTLPQLAESLSVLMTILHLRGPNIDNMMEANTKDKTCYEKFVSYKNVLALCAKAGKDTTAITLPRIALVFPNASLFVWQSVKGRVQLPITSSKVGFSEGIDAFPNHVPSFIDDTFQTKDKAKILMMHTLYQCHLSFLVQVPPKKERLKQKYVIKPIEEFFASSIRYAAIARRGSQLNDTSKINGFEKIKTGCDKVSHADVLLAMKKVLKQNKSSSIFEVEPTTIYEYFAQYYVTIGEYPQDINTIIDSDITLDNLRSQYPF